MNILKTTNLKRYSQLMSVLTFIPLSCLIIACFSPILFYFFNTNNIGIDSEGFSLFVNMVVDINPDKLVFWQKLLATLLDTSLILILVYGFNQLRLLFISYSHANYFSVKSSTHCFNFGRALVFWVILSFIFEPILSVILTFYDSRTMGLSLSSEQIITLFPALGIMIIGQILKKACQIAEENKQFV